MATGNRLLTKFDVAAILRIPPTKVARLARDDTLPHVVLPGDELRFVEQELWHWISTQSRSHADGLAEERDDGRPVPEERGPVPSSHERSPGWSQTDQCSEREAQ